ncbi:MAG: hypothetical protein M0026_03610 [Nocardiopsaceae bacterium]|nr:hypothetical protein [Nocardiopsaceae bacterium]
MTTTTALPFHVGRDYDAEMASDGHSRFGHYVREAVAADRDPWDSDDGRAEWAALVWRAATPPVMAPGYVRYHHLIQGARLYRSQWDGALLASVSIATPPPAPLTRLRDWHGWPTELSGGEYVPVDPSERQVSEARGGFLLTVTELAFALPETVLPALPATPDAPGLAHDAAVAVGALVGALNDAVSPVIEAL